MTFYFYTLTRIYGDQVRLSHFLFHSKLKLIYLISWKMIGCVLAIDQQLLVIFGNSILLGVGVGGLRKKTVFC
jgi:hypothetical protein